MIIGISGAIGSGKSHTQLKMALYYAQMREKQLVFNFRVNRYALKQYCESVKYDWVLGLLDKGGVCEIVNPSSLESLLLPGSIVCLDEAGVFLNSRAFASTPKTLLASLAQSRKGNKVTRGGVDLLYCAQFNEQVDRQVRLLTQYWVHCDGVEAFNRKEKRPELIWKRIFWMKAYDYNRWNSDEKARTSYLKTRFAYAFKYEGGPLSKLDRLVFKCYQSTDRLDTVAGNRIWTADCCQIADKPRNYGRLPACARLPSLSPPRYPNGVSRGGGPGFFCV